MRDRPGRSDGRGSTGCRGQATNLKRGVDCPEKGRQPGAESTEEWAARSARTDSTGVIGQHESAVSPLLPRLARNSFYPLPALDVALRLKSYRTAYSLAKSFGSELDHVQAVLAVAQIDDAAPVQRECTGSFERV